MPRAVFVFAAFDPKAVFQGDEIPTMASASLIASGRWKLSKARR